MSWKPKKHTTFHPSKIKETFQLFARKNGKPESQLCQLEISSHTGKFYK